MTATSISSSPVRATLSGRWRTRTIRLGLRFSMPGSFSTTPGRMAAAVARIVTLPDDVWQRRVHAYRCQARLYGGYFLKQANERGDEFLLRHSAVHLCLSVGRVALAVNRILFRGQKYLAATLPQLAELPDGFLAAWRSALEHPTPDTAAVLTNMVDAWQGGPLSLEDTLSTFIIDNELTWLNETVPPEFW